MRKATDRTANSFDLRQPWVWSMLFAMGIPIFPEYAAPFLAIVSLLFAAGDAKRHHRSVRVGATGKVIIALLCFATVHLIWADNRLFSGFTVLCWIAMLCVYLALSTVLTTPRRIETALFSLSMVTGALGILACVQFFLVEVMGKDMALYVAWAPVDLWIYSWSPIKVELAIDVNRVCATFGNSNLFAEYLVMAIPLIATYGFTGKRRFTKIVARVMLLFSVAGLFLSQSRGGYLALIAVAIVICIANMRRFIPILMVACSVLLLLPDAIYERLATIGNSADYPIMERFELWGIGMQLFGQAPLFGHGFGVSSTLEAIQQAGYYNAHVHNLIVQFLAEGGIVGLILLLYLIWKMFRTGFELIIHAPASRMYGAAVISFCAGFCVFGMVDYPLFTPKVVGIFLMMLAFTDAFGFSQVKRASCTVLQAIPFYPQVHDRLEAWVKKKTAPRDEREADSKGADQET